MRSLGLSIPRVDRGNVSGFTLIELIVIIVVLAILAGVATPIYLDYSMKTKVAVTANNWKLLSRAVYSYIIDRGDFPSNVSDGIMPPEMRPYLTDDEFTKKPAIGGMWDYDDWRTYTGNWVSVSLTQSNQPTTVFQQIDKLIDDGDVNTGRLFYYGAYTRYTFKVWP